MKPNKCLELKGAVGWKEKGHWTIGELAAHLERETPAGWVVDNFNIEMVPPPPPESGTRKRSKPEKP